MTDVDPSAAPSTTVGTALRQARTLAGRSVEQVCAATRIRPQIVNDLEADRFASSGGTVYARGHLRAIAHYLGADVTPLVELFDEQTGTRPFEPSHALPLPAPRAPSSSLHVPLPAEPERSSPRWVLAGVATLAVLAGLFLVGSLTGGDDVAADPEPSAPGVVAPSTQSVARPAVKPAPEPRPAGALLGIRLVGGKAWISVTTPEKVLFEGTVPAGWSKQFFDPAQVRVKVGNAGAVRVSCGGGMGVPAGAVGQVARIVCGPEGLVRP